MNILVIGDGSAGKRHARLLTNRGHKCLVLGPRDITGSFTSEGVIIATPPDWHEYNIRAWQSHHLLCEGPCTCLPKPGITQIHMMASNWRFIPELQKLKAKKELPVLAHFWYNHDLNLWRPDTDIKNTCYYWCGHDMINVHEVDTAFWLFGPAEELKVYKLYTGKTRACDGYTMMIKHKTGVLTTINSSWHNSFYTRGYRLNYANGRQESQIWHSPDHDDLVNQSYEDMIDHWLQHIEEGNPLVEPNLEDGYRAYKALQGECV